MGGGGGGGGGRGCVCARQRKREKLCKGRNRVILSFANVMRGYFPLPAFTIHQPPSLMHSTRLTATEFSPSLTHVSTQSSNSNTQVHLHSHINSVL